MTGTTSIINTSKESDDVSNSICNNHGGIPEHEITSNDILCGQGVKSLKDHPGNVLLRQFLIKCLDHYKAAKTASERNTVIKTLIDTIKATTGARFVSKRSNDSNLWYELPAPKQERDKISHAIRFLLKQEKEGKLVVDTDTDKKNRNEPNTVESEKRSSGTKQDRIRKRKKTKNKKDDDQYSNNDDPQDNDVTVSTTTTDTKTKRLKSSSNTKSTKKNKSKKYTQDSTTIGCSTIVRNTETSTVTYNSSNAVVSLDSSSTETSIHPFSSPDNIIFTEYANDDDSIYTYDFDPAPVDSCICTTATSSSPFGCTDIYIDVDDNTSYQVYQDCQHDIFDTTKFEFDDNTIISVEGTSSFDDDMLSILSSSFLLEDETECNLHHNNTNNNEYIGNTKIVTFEPEISQILLPSSTLINERTITIPWFVSPVNKNPTPTIETVDDKDQMFFMPNDLTTFLDENYYDLNMETSNGKFCYV